MSQGEKVALNQQVERAPAMTYVLICWSDLLSPTHCGPA
jgi:hypothetical protein